MGKGDYANGCLDTLDLCDHEKPVNVNVRQDSVLR